MPSASTAKLEKQASSEAGDPIKQGITMVDHKIRNLNKKKARLDEYREKQKAGTELEPDQKLAILKYDEVCQNLNFAQELSKQLNNISVEAEKVKKRKEKKEAYEREQQEVSKVKEILIIQDVLASMGTDSVREDFLAGRNKAIKLTETELQYLDDLFVEVSPKREPEEGQPPFLEQAQNAAKHLLNIVEGKDKEIVGTKYSVLKELVEKISNSGYFDQTAVEESVPQETEAPVVEQPPVIEPPEPQPEEIVVSEAVPSATFQPSGAPGMEPVVPTVVETAGLYISQRPMADVLTNVMGGGPTTFNFIQESELEPEVAVVPPPALPIPTQTFTNANFAPPPGAVAPVYPTHQPPQQEVMYATPAQYSPVPPPQSQAPLQPAAVPAAVPVPAQQFDNANSFQTTKPQSGAGDWNDTTTEQNDDWAIQVEQSEQNRWNETTQQSDEWAENSNDGFQPASRGGGRGGRGRGGGSERGRGGPRGGRGGGYQNGRGNYGNNQNNRGGGNYYRNNNDGGNNYYQNGYQSRGDGERGERGYRGGDRRGGSRGGQQDRGGNRGAPRGSGGRGGNPRGGSRGNRQ